MQDKATPKQRKIVHNKRKKPTRKRMDAATKTLLANYSFELVMRIAYKLFVFRTASQCVRFEMTLIVLLSMFETASTSLHGS